MEKKRIDALDGFRALAILAVVCFHYLSRWTAPRSPRNLYPYGDALAQFPVANYGYLGVELFFIVSGFVISMTLFSSATWSDFTLRRFARLFPTMLLCSILTFVFLSFAPLDFFSVRFKDFLPSLTLIDPFLWKYALKSDFQYIDGAYWSLFVEVRFYFWACVIFFAFGKARFLAAFSVFFNAALALFLLGQALGSEALRQANDWLLFFGYLPWLTAGVGFFYLHRDGANRLALGLVIEAAVVLVLMAAAQGVRGEIPFDLLFFAMFFAFVYRPRWVSLFAWKPLTMVGAASYSLYLLHQDIGVTLIAMIANLLPAMPAELTLLIPAVVTLLLIGASLLIFTYWEMPAKTVILAVGRPGAGKARGA